MRYANTSVNNNVQITQNGTGNTIKVLSGPADLATARKETTLGIVGNTATVIQAANAGFNVAQLGQTGIGKAVLIDQSGI